MAITVTFPGGKRVDAAVGNFAIQTDQPRDEGGDGTAPAPFTYFLASLATCAGLYVLGFCQARGISTEGLKLVQSQVFDRETHRLTQVAIRIELPPGFPAKYANAVKNAAENCKVKKTISDPPEFVIEVAGTAPAISAIQ